MLKNHLKIAFRNLFKYKLHSLINIGGLAIGLSCALLIMLWVRDETGYDRFHPDADQMYRVNWIYKYNDTEGVGSGTPPPLAAALQNDIPEIAATMRIYPVSDEIVRSGEAFFNEGRIFAVDAGFFDFFDFKLVSGNAQSALSEPNCVVLTEDIARKYFGAAPAIGKLILIGEKKAILGKAYDNAFRVTGVVENPPHKSHLQFDMLTSMSSHPQVAFFDWSWVWMQVTTYIKLKSGAIAGEVDALIPELVETYAPAAFERIGFSYTEHLANGGLWGFQLQPMTDIYLGSVRLGNRLGPLGNRVYVYLFIVIAVFILFIACTNFINLTMARSVNRAKEVGVRKVLGSQKHLLISQFLVESMMLSTFALPLAIIIAELFITPLNLISGKSLRFDLFNPAWLPAVMLLFTLLIGLLAGSYPAFVLSSFKPVRVLRGKLTADGRSRSMGNGLVVFQFAITIGLIACTVLVETQMAFLHQSDLGFQKEGVVVISNQNNRLGDQSSLFKENLKADRRILSASVSSGIPPHDGFEDYYRAEGKGDQQFSLISYLTDDDFVSTLGVEIIAGRGFSKAFSTEARSVILNEEAVKTFGWDDPLGKTINYPDQGDFAVIGVMKDFNMASLHSRIAPFALFHSSSNSYQIADSYVVVRVDLNDLGGVLNLLASEWQNIAPSTPFEYEFLDESLEQSYLTEARLGKMFIIFSSLSIFTACLGLFGMVSLMARQRSKEVGVRKVLGASVAGIVSLLSRDFIKLVLLANLIAWPVAWYAMTNWLANFAYRVEIGWWIFALAGALALITALLTVSYQAIRAALANPVESLKCE